MNLLNQSQSLRRIFEAKTSAPRPAKKLEISKRASERSSTMTIFTCSMNGRWPAMPTHIFFFYFDWTCLGGWWK